ncbi:MAG: S41 family peptidase, partial [Pseudomonadota bacterium]
MLRSLRSVCLALVLGAGSAAASDPLLSPAALREDIALAREALERIHPGYERYTARRELDALWEAIETDTPRRWEDVYIDLSRVLAAVRCDHTKAELPKAAVEARATAPVYLPFRFRLFEAGDRPRMIVLASAIPGVERGDEILEIDGDPVADRIAPALDLIPVDGFTDHVRGVQLAATGEFLGSGFDHFDPLLNDVPPTVVLRVGRDGDQRTVTGQRIGFDAFRAIETGERRVRNLSDDGAVELDFPAPGVGVLSVATYVNYRTPVDPHERYAPYFEAIRERGVHTLILDNRRNGGGSTDAQEALVSRLITAPVRTVAEVRVKTIDLDGLREHLGTWDATALNPPAEIFDRSDDGWWILKPEFGGGGPAIEPHPESFGGRLIVLTSRGNASGAATTLLAMKKTGRANLIGEATGGAQAGPTANIIFFLT